ncbi:hypothetical protein DY124_07540 [Apilactobacillus micheneri]|uniref:hypothetical protein n=1 Tax=Apilactobacillus micheneri TaxID=1899430 RepID=UPI001127129E|nr:hypothetical protein [Apilactobacillus micheneri]TPR42349.1 hypothetical protein DY124_07540 [Apilactobacillus micheneri]TPR47070.1 hypothetical protein DY125_07470 [Apilactobacillus micheneri]
MSFKNFSKLQNYLEKNNYNFYAYNAKYNQINCDVLISTDIKDLIKASFIHEPLMSLEFIKNPHKTTEDSIIIIIGKKELSEVIGNKNFYKFFQIKKDNNGNRINFKKILADFLQHMDKQFPNIININKIRIDLKDHILRKINEKNDPGYIFFNVMKNPNGRSNNNNEKAKMLVDPIIFDYFENKINYSFCFTNDKTKELKGNNGLKTLKKRISER